MQNRLENLGYITVAQAAKITGLTEGTIRVYLSQGVFARHKIGYAVFLDEEEVINYRNKSREKEGGMTSREQEIIELAIELVGIHDKLRELEVYGERKDFQLWGDDFIDLFKDTEIEVDVVDKERKVAIFRKRVEIGDNIIVFYNIPNLERKANPLYLEAYNKALEALDETED